MKLKRTPVCEITNITDVVEFTFKFKQALRRRIMRRRDDNKHIYDVLIKMKIGDNFRLCQKNNYVFVEKYKCRWSRKKKKWWNKMWDEIERAQNENSEWMGKQ